MPAYDFICDACGHTFVDSHPMSEPHPTKCPECEKDRVRVNFVSPPAYHNHMSPMHPRRNRGRGH